MKQKLPKKLPQVKRLQNFLAVILLCFSLQSYATTEETLISNEDTWCGSISGFKFSNGNSSTTITNGGEYYIGDLPNNFYINVLVSGYSRSARIKVKNFTRDSMLIFKKTIYHILFLTAEVHGVMDQVIMKLKQKFINIIVALVGTVIKKKLDLS